MDSPQATVEVRRPRRKRAGFHPLTVAGVRRLTDDSVEVAFGVPDPLRTVFDFAPGQHLTVRRVDGGEEVRRSYSICSTPADLVERGEIRIGVRRVAGGAFS